LVCNGVCDGVSFLEDGSLIFLAFDDDGERLIKTDMPQKSVFINSFLPVEIVYIKITIIQIRVDGKITYLKRGEILKEVRALTRINSVILKPDSTIILAEEIWGQITGIPSQLSLEPQRPGPTKI